MSIVGLGSVKEELQGMADGLVADGLGEIERERVSWLLQLVDTVGEAMGGSDEGAGMSIAREIVASGDDLESISIRTMVICNAIDDLRERLHALVAGGVSAQSARSPNVQMDDRVRALEMELVAVRQAAEAMAAELSRERAEHRASLELLGRWRKWGYGVKEECRTASVDDLESRLIAVIREARGQ